MAADEEKPASGKRSTFDRLLGETAEQKFSRAMESGFGDAVKEMGEPLDWAAATEAELPRVDGAPVSKRSTDRGVGPVRVSDPGAPEAVEDAPSLTITEITKDDRTVSAGDDALPDVAANQKKDWEAQRAQDPRADANEDLPPLEDRDTRKRPQARNVLGRHVVAGIYTVETDYDWNDPEKAQRAEEEILRAKEEAEKLAPGSEGLLKLATEMRAKYGALIGPEADAVDATSHAAIASLLVDVAKESAEKDAKLEEVRAAAETERAGRLHEQERANALAETAQAERIRADERENVARAARYEAEQAKVEKAKVADELVLTKQRLADRAAEPATTSSKKTNWVPLALFLSLFVIGFLIWLATSGSEETAPAPVNTTVFTPVKQPAEAEAPSTGAPDEVSPDKASPREAIGDPSPTPATASASSPAPSVGADTARPVGAPKATAREAASATPPPSAKPTSTVHDPFAKPDF